MKKSLFLLFMVSLFIPSAEADDADDLTRLLGDYFQIYVLKPDHRSAEDRVNVKSLGRGRYSAEISYWRSLKSRDPADEICNAYRWILLGRGVYGKGAMEAFDKFSSLDEIELKFFDMEFTTKLGKKRAEILPSEKVIPYLKVGVKRSSLDRKKPSRADIENQITKNQCAAVGKQYLDTVWFDENYLRQGKST